MVLALCGFGAFFGVQLIKTALPNPMKSYWKIGLALVISYGISASLFTHNPHQLAVYGVAGAGLALLIHRISRLASVAGDWYIHEILRNRPRSR